MKLDELGLRGLLLEWGAMLELELVVVSGLTSACRCVGPWGSFIRSPRSMKYVAHPLIRLGLFVGERSAGTIFECLDQHPLMRGTD